YVTGVGEASEATRGSGGGAGRETSTAIVAGVPVLPVGVVVVGGVVLRLAHELPLKPFQIHIRSVVLQLTSNLRLLCLGTAATHGLTPSCCAGAARGFGRPSFI